MTSIVPRARRVPILPLVGLCLLGLEAALSAVGRPFPSLSALLFVVAVGLAVLTFVPAALKRLALAVPLVPILGVAGCTTILVSAAGVHVPLTPLTIRLLLPAAVLLAAAAAAAAPQLVAALPAFEPRRELAALSLFAAVLAGVAALQSRVIGATPVPGADWGHYLLYADQIRVHHALLIDNPLWMGGHLPFPDDPGAAALYGAYLIVGHQAASVLLQGIWVFALLGVASVWVMAGALWGTRAAVIAAALYGVLPMGLDMLAWHGLANMYALALVPLVLLAACAIVRGSRDRRWPFLLAFAVVTLAGAHRLSVVVVTVALLPVAAVVVVRFGRPGWRTIAIGAGLAIVGGAGVIAYLYQLNTRTGGVPSFHAFTTRKPNWDSTMRDLTSVVVVLGLVSVSAVLVGVRRGKRDPAGLVIAAFIAAPIALSYGWVAHIPLDYVRMSYFLGIPLAVAVGAASTYVARPIAVAVAVATIAFVGVRAYHLGAQFRSFYQFANPTSIRGLEYLAARSAGSRAPIVADACWGFLAPWLLDKPVLAGLSSWQISVNQEVAPARRARVILYGGEAGDRLARQLGVRYAIVDPGCTSARGRPLTPPTLDAQPIYVSSGLVVLEVSGKGR